MWKPKYIVKCDGVLHESGSCRHTVTQHIFFFYLGARSQTKGLPMLPRLAWTNYVSQVNLEFTVIVQTSSKCKILLPQPCHEPPCLLTQFILPSEEWLWEACRPCNSHPPSFLRKESINFLVRSVKVCVCASELTEPRCWEVVFISRINCPSNKQMPNFIRNLASF